MNPRRPTYTIPQEVQDKLGQNAMNLNARSAGAARAQDNIFQSQATTIQNAQQSGGGVGNQLLAGAMAQANTNRSLADLSASEREDYQRRLGQLGQAQSEMAGYRDKAFDFNQVQPYENAAAAKSALIQGGIQNLFGASQGFMSLGDGGNQQQNQPLTQQATAPADPYSGLIRPFSTIQIRNGLNPVRSMTGGYIPQPVTNPWLVPSGRNLMFQNQDAYNSGVYRNNYGKIG